MGLAAAETALIEYLAAELADCLGWTEEEAAELRVLRYHGRRSVPPYCCTEVGTIIGSWETVDTSSLLGQRSRQVPGKLAMPGATLILRYLTCWPAPDPTEQGPRLVDAEWDAAAARLATVVECGARALVCVQDSATAEADALLENTGCDGFTFLGAEPIEPSVNCAGVLFRCYLSLVGAGGVS